MMRVVVLGYGPMGTAMCKGVLKCPAIATLVGVLPWSFLPGKHWARQESGEKSFRHFLHQNHISIIQATSVNNYAFLSTLQTLQPDVVLVGSWGEILKPHLLSLPNCRFINCHPSLLPMHRGPNPYTASILSGETYTGITFHEIDAGIDTGPILLQSPLPINLDETGGSLRNRCAALAEETLPTLLDGLFHQQLRPQSQPIGGSYESNSVDVGCVDWLSSPEALDRQFRACHPWIELITQLGHRAILFSKGRLIVQSENLSALDPSPLIPGQILNCEGNTIRVATVDPRYQACLSQPQFGSLPEPLNPLMARFILRPGKKFSRFH